MALPPFIPCLASPACLSYPCLSTLFSSFHKPEAFSPPESSRATAKRSTDHQQIQGGDGQLRDREHVRLWKDKMGRSRPSSIHVLTPL